jgi:hypothetical protein
MIRRNRDVSRQNLNQSNSKCANRRASYRKTNLAHAIRVMAPALFALTFASVAHAQGTMDFSGAQTLMGTFNWRNDFVGTDQHSRFIADGIYVVSAEAHQRQARRREHHCSDLQHSSRR